MNLHFEEVLNNLGTWISKLTPNQNNFQLINTLALIRVYQLNKGFWDVELKETAKDILQSIDTLDYSKSHLTTALLACDLILELGNNHLVEQTSVYTSFLKELSALDTSHRNDCILKTAFNKMVSPPRKQLQLNIPKHERDIDKMILNVLEKIETQTCFGQLDFYLDDTSILQIESMAIRAQRSYDFPLAMRCLRARNYLSTTPSLMMNTSCDFIKYEQNNDGSFGDYQADVQSVNNIESRRKILLKMKTVVALEVIWTIYEWNGNNLFSALSYLKLGEQKIELKSV